MVSLNVIVPAKILTKSKTRLSHILSDEQKNRLVINMLKDVLTALSDSSHISYIAVITSDEKLSHIGREYDARIIRDPETGDLNDALSFATTELMKDHPKIPLLVIPSDIPLIDEEVIEGIVEVFQASQGKTIIATSSKSNGTNALLRFPPNVIETFFGPLSFIKHREAAEAKGIAFKTYDCNKIELDLDTIDDMMEILTRGPHTQTAETIQEFIETGTTM